MKKLTQEVLFEHFAYNPDTGFFYYLHNGVRADKVRIKYIAGILDKSAYGVGYSFLHVPRHGTYLAHRLVWMYCYGVWPDGLIDHINHIKHDNRLCNLRVVTRRQNLLNCRSKHAVAIFGGYQDDYNLK